MQHEIPLCHSQLVSMTAFPIKVLVQPGATGMEIVDFSDFLDAFYPNIWTSAHLEDTIYGMDMHTAQFESRIPIKSCQRLAVSFLALKDAWVQRRLNASKNTL